MLSIGKRHAERLSASIDNSTRIVTAAFYERLRLSREYRKPSAAQSATWHPNKQSAARSTKMHRAAHDLYGRGILGLGLSFSVVCGAHRVLTPASEFGVV